MPSPYPVKSAWMLGAKNANTCVSRFLTSFAGQPWNCAAAIHILLFAVS
jgi:hypothetical protein